MNFIHAYFVIIAALSPGDEAEECQDLRLDAQGHVELLGDVVHSKRNTCPRPQHHHGGLQAGGVMATVVDDDLRDKLPLI